MNILIIGPAGSGKSYLTSEFGKYLETNYTVSYINLDSGAIRIPFSPDFDVRNYFTLEEIMKNKDLGPNGATLEAVDRLSSLEMPEYDTDFVLIDTPGQLEPFVFRGGVDSFRDLAKGSIFLIDSTAPLKTFPSQYLYSLSSQYALDLPMIRALNKIDLLEPERIEELEEMIMDPRLIREVDEFGMRSQINMDIADLLFELSKTSPFPAISAETGDGFENLITYVLQVFQTHQNVEDTQDE